MLDSTKFESIPEEDLYYFNIGEHKRIHRYLGAHHLGNGVRFAVWAPNALKWQLLETLMTGTYMPTP